MLQMQTIPGDCISRVLLQVGRLLERGVGIFVAGQCFGLLGGGGVEDCITMKCTKQALGITTHWMQSSIVYKYVLMTFHFFLLSACI